MENLLFIGVPILKHIRVFYGEIWLIITKLSLLPLLNICGTRAQDKLCFDVNSDIVLPSDSMCCGLAPDDRTIVLMSGDNIRLEWGMT